MSLKPKTVRRLTLLGLVSFLVVGSAFSLLVVRRWQNNRVTQRAGDEAIAAQQKGDHFIAMNAAGTFIKRAKTSDPRYVDLLKMYADERLQVEEPRAAHLFQAISFYRSYLERRPEDRATRLHLLELFTKARFFAEARDLAKELLPGDLVAATPADAPVLRNEAIALYSTRAGNSTSDQRLQQLFERLAQLQPLNVRNESIRLEWLAQSGRQSEGRAYADGLLAANPGDPRAELLVVISRDLDRRPGEASDQFIRLCRAAGLNPDAAVRVQPPAFHDLEFAETLIGAFDRFNRFDHSLQVLQDAASAFDEPDLKRTLARRLWQEGRFEDLELLTAKLDPAILQSDPDMLGFRALGLIGLNRPKDADAIAAGLARREGIFKALTWAKVIPLARDQQVTGVRRVEQLEDIIKANPEEPVVTAMLGDALAAVGRTDEARTQWETAGKNPKSVAWPVPWTRVAETGLAEGRFEQAAQAAATGLAKAPRRVALHVLWFDAQAALVQRGSSEAAPVREILERITKTDAALANVGSAEAARYRDRLLPSRVLLLARAGKPEEARAAARGAIEAALASSADLSENTLRRLAAISEAEHLGMEQECIARAEAQYGQTAGVVLTRALELASAGNPDAGLTKLREAAQSHPGDLSFQVSLARYLERIGHPDALKTWKALGEANRSNLDAQRSILMSDAAVAERAFIETTIERYAKIAGEGGGADYYARTARARALVHGSPTRRDRDEAVAILSGVVAQQPALIEPKLLLASVLSLSDPSRDIAPDLPRAVAQLTDAAAREPRSARVALELAQIYQAQHEWDRSREQLVRIASDASFDPDSRAEAAKLLIGQGEAGPVAVAALTEITNQLGNRASPALLLLLAHAHVMLRQDEKAAPVYDALVQRSADPDSILMAASFFARRSDQARADAALARLDSMNLSPGIRQLALARYAAEQGQDQDARTQFEAAIAAAPSRVDAWRHYISFHLARRDTGAAVEVAQRALKAVPGDTTLVALAERARLLTSDPGSGEVASLVEALAKDPAMAEAAQTIRLLQQALDRGQLASADDLLRLADRYPANAAIQMFVARRIAGSDQARAAVIIDRAIKAAPNDPTPAKLAAEIHLSAKRWNDMLEAATIWRQRDLTRSAEPDVAIAEAYYNLKEYAKGVEVLAPRVSAAAADPTKPFALQVLNTQARLLIAGSREADARSLLAPLISSSREVRLGIWLPLIAQSLPPEASSSWLDQARAALTPAPDEQLALAMVYDALSTRIPAESARFIGEARSLLTRLAEKPETATPAVVEALGVLLHRTGDLKGAEAAYRRAIELDPKRAIALNNLASIVLEARDLDQGLALAKRAVEASGGSDASSLDTLAQAHHAIAAKKAGDPATAAAVNDDFKQAAAAYLKCAQLSPSPAEPLANAAKCSEYASDIATAAQCYEAMLKLPGLTPQRAAGTKSNLAQSIIRLKRKDQYDRARTLAAEAVEAAPVAPLFDTLGWVELTAGRYEAAIDAFRRGVASAPGQPVIPSTAIGLALALCAGTPEQKAEARALLESVKRESLDPETREHFRRASECASGAAPR
jgi:tetratricopeptide (TPR) repeat protein